VSSWIFLGAGFNLWGVLELNVQQGNDIAYNPWLFKKIQIFCVAGFIFVLFDNLHAFGQKKESAQYLSWVAD